MLIHTRPLSYRLGVEILGIDLREPIDARTFAAIRHAFNDAGGLALLRGQDITREHHLAFSRLFGELDSHDAVPLDRHPKHHEILIVASEPVVANQNNDRYVGQNWHSDMASSLRPAMGSLLRAVTVPPVGGDTLFSNMTAAYDSLSSGLKRLVEGLHGVYQRERPDLDADWQQKNRAINPPVAQPLVRTHPETGRKALYIGERMKCFEGMTPRESAPLLALLLEQATQPQLTYRHQWQTNDLLIWDNRCTIHMALGDFDHTLYRRHLERTTIKGNPSGHLYTTIS